MKLSHFIKRVEKTKSFKNFKKEHSNSYLCAGFFVLDYETGKDLHQIDYALSDGKIATFYLDDDKVKISDPMIKKKIEELKGDTKLDLEQLKGMVHDEMENHTVTEEIKKIIAVVQNVDGKKTWILNCILSGLNILKVHIDDDTGNLLAFEKANVMDFMRRMM